MHLERQMPKYQKSIKARNMGEKVDLLWVEQEFYKREISEAEIELRLKIFGLDPYEVELIMLRFVENLSMADIVDTQGWLSLSSANHYLRETLKRLRKGGFQLR